MMTKHFEPKKAVLWRDVLELSPIFPVTPMQCAPKKTWRPLRVPWRPDVVPHIAEPPKLGGCPHTCEILLTDKKKNGGDRDSMRIHVFIPYWCSCCGQRFSPTPRKGSLTTW
eukprot:5301632-Pyramimonas_sp.AAC.1